MSQTTVNEGLIPLTVNGQASGNYDGSSLDWYSDPVKAGNYYRASSLQSVAINVEDFVGVFTIQGTQDQDTSNSVSARYVPPGSPIWADIGSYGDPDNTVPITDYHYVSILGNYTWIRIHVTGFTQGTIRQVQLFY
jgi:hypothetical protein